MEATKELEMMKDGARRMQEFLEAKGIEVKHSMMLEALSAGFGSRNWRTVREKLNTPSLLKPTLESLDGLRWHVFGVYCDNDQPYNECYPGDDAHEAQVIAQIERMFAEDGSDIDVHYVMDRLTAGKDAETYCFDHADFVTGPHSETLLAVTDYARRCLGEYRGNSIADAEAWDLKNVHLEVFEEELKSSSCCEVVDEIDKFTKENQGFNDEHTFTWVDSRGVEYEGVNASVALETMLDIIKPFGVEQLSDEMKTHVYQVRALLKYAPKELDYVFGYEI